MSQVTNLYRLSFTVAALSATSLTYAAGLDRSGQDVTSFFQEGTYAEIDVVHVSADISGYDNANIISPTADGYVKGKEISDIANDYNFVRYGVKADVNDNISVGVIYDQPWGASVEIKGDNNFVSGTNKKVPVIIPGTKTVSQLDNQFIDGKVGTAGYNPDTKVDLETHNWTTLVGVKSNGFQVYGGPVIQKVNADISLRGPAYSSATGYTSKSEDTAVGWAAGASYSNPEIALNAAVTYRSSIKHKADVTETMPVITKPLPGLNRPFDTTTVETEVTTPESVNVNFQTGLSAKHQLLGIVNARWVPWSKFDIKPPLYNAATKIQTGDDVGLPLVSYEKDQWQVDVGIGKRISPKLAVSGVVGWDSGAGNPVTSLGPIDGYWSVGGGAKYNITDEWAISAGGKYLKFGDAKAALPNGYIVGDFEKNDGYVVGAKLSYQSKNK